MANEDLFTALQMFQNGAKEYALSRAIAGANEQVMQAKASLSNEQEQRAALQQISNGLVSQMAGMGAPASTIQAVAGAMGPKQYATADQAILEGALSGNSSLMQAGQEADKASTSNQMALYQKKAEIDAAAQARLFAQQEKLATIKANKVSNAQQKQGDVEFGTNVKVAMTEANKLKAIIKKDGNAEVWNTDSAAKLNQAAYQLAINYAKIVDPASVAREGEVAAAQKYMVPLGWDTRNSVSLAAINAFQDKIKEYVKARAEQRAKGGSAPAVPQDMLAPVTAKTPAGTLDLSKYLE